MKSITLELPEEILARLDPSDDIVARARKALVLELLRDAYVMQGEAALLLGVTRYDILDLMAEHCIPSGPLTAEEMRQDIENAWHLIEPIAINGGG